MGILYKNNVIIQLNNILVFEMTSFCHGLLIFLLFFYFSGLEKIKGIPLLTLKLLTKFSLVFK